VEQEKNTLKKEQEQGETMWLYGLVWYALLFIMDFYIVE
jgi:hypothetical protein